MATKFVDNVDEDTDDDFWDLAASYIKHCPTRRPTVICDCVNPLTDLDDGDFRLRFRLTKWCFTDLLEGLEPKLTKQQNVMAVYSDHVQKFFLRGS